MPQDAQLWSLDVPLMGVLRLECGEIVLTPSGRSLFQASTAPTQVHQSLSNQLLLRHTILSLHSLRTPARFLPAL